MSTAFLTDQYELTMLDAAIHSGVAGHRAIFEVFARHLPPGRRYGVVAGTGRLLEALEEFSFTPEQVGWLGERRLVSPDTLDWLRGYRFSGDIRGFAEGELYFADSPVLTVDATFGEGVLLETLALSILNHDSAVASAAARMVSAAGGRPLIEMGSRRTHERAAVAAARAAYVAGFSSTSNLEAGRCYGIPTAGTAAHAFVLAHRTETAAFEAQLAAMGPETTLLVDTFDVLDGLRAAVLAARAVGAAGPGAVRIDSGDLAVGSQQARALLDELGAGRTGIVVSGDLDEFGIAALASTDAPVDGFGVGTRVVTGSGAPTAELIFKLVAIADGPGAGAPMRPVAKRSEAKVTVGGCKSAVRLLDAGGRARTDEVLVGDCGDVGVFDGSSASGRPGSGQPGSGQAGSLGRSGLSGRPGSGQPGSGQPGSGQPGRSGLSGRQLQVALVRGGEIVHRPTVHEAREHHRAALSELAPSALDLTPGPPAVEVHLVADR